MNPGDIDVTFAPPAGDRTTLSKKCLATLDALYRHPLAHNLEWPDVVSLFTRLGTVHAKSHNELVFQIGGEHHVVHKPHGKDLDTAAVMDIRQLLTRAGWSPHLHATAQTHADSAPQPHPAAQDLLIVIDHHAATLYHMAVGLAEPVDDVIRPYDPHGFLHHLAHKDQSRERGQRAPEDHSFYQRIVEAIAASRKVVVIEQGKGHSNAGHHLIEYLERHHPLEAAKVTHEVVAAISSLTPAQLLVVGRRALS